MFLKAFKLASWTFPLSSLLAKRFYFLQSHMYRRRDVILNQSFALLIKATIEEHLIKSPFLP
jgi:hypothetical protein